MLLLYYLIKYVKIKIFTNKNKMTDLIHNLSIFQDISKSNIISNYESSKDFISGAIEQHLGNILQAQKSATSFNFTKIINDLKEAFSGEFNKRATVNIDYDFLKKSKNSSINKEYIYVMTAFIIGELLDYSEQHGVDVSEFRKRTESHLDNLKEHMVQLEQYFIELEKLSKLCDNFHKVSRVNEAKGVIICQEIKTILNDKSNLINRITYSDDENYLKLSGVMSELNSISDIRDEIVQKIKLTNNKNLFTLADTYIKNQNTLTPLQKSIFDKNIKAKLEFTAAQDLSGIILFSDNSICCRSKNNEYQVIDTSLDARRNVRALYYSAIDFTLRKKPKLSIAFQDKMAERMGSPITVMNTINRFLENEILVKNYLKNDYDLFLRNLLNEKSIEVFDDQFTKIAEEQKFKLFAYSIASNKYIHLYNDESLSLLREIYDNNRDKEQLQIYVGKKIAAFKTPDEFNRHLERYLSKINGFSPEIILEAVEECAAVLVSNVDDIIIVETEFYQQMNHLGSNNWCIVRDEGYYDDYAGNGNRQYIVFDFNKAASDVNSMIGITLSETGKYRNAHVKDDVSIDKDDIEQFTDTIIMAQRDTFKNLDKKIEERLYPKTNNTKLKIA